LVWSSYTVLSCIETVYFLLEESWIRNKDKKKQNSVQKIDKFLNF